MSLNRLSDIFTILKDKFPTFRKRYKEAEAVGNWETVVGNAIAKHTRAIRVEKGILWVEVDHAIWKSELHHRKRQILDLLNQPVSREPQQACLKTKSQAKPSPSPEPLQDILFLDSGFSLRKSTPQPYKSNSNRNQRKY